MKLNAVIFGVLATVSVGASAVDIKDGTTYFCQTNLSVGYVHNPQRGWIKADFDPAPLKYAVTYSNGKWAANKFGENLIENNCKLFGSFVRCNLNGEFLMSIENNRFERIFSIGYVQKYDGHFEPKDVPTPMYDIGVCHHL